MFPRLLCAIASAVLLRCAAAVLAFRAPIRASIRQRQRRCQRQRQGQGGSWSALGSGATDDDGGAASAEAEELLAKARAIRESLGTAGGGSSGSKTSSGEAHRAIQSEFSLRSSPRDARTDDNSFRLYLDVGREPGTWMDPRWGASGRRIECTLDVAFPRPGDEDGARDVQSQFASEEITAGLVKTVTSKSSTLSPVYQLQFAPYARLRGGFDRMSIKDGGYCIESSASASPSSSSTLRFCISVDGTKDGDVTIPEGHLYFALPYFGTSGGAEGDDARMNLSTKEGTVTVKQMGWHTGWRREESRILGVFRAVPLEKARVRDKY